MTVMLVPAIDHDEPELLPMIRQLRVDDPMSNSTYDDAVAAIRLLIANPALGMVLMIRTNNVSVGYVVLAYTFSIEFGGRNVFIDELFVSSHQRGKGVGAATLEAIASRCKAEGFRAINLEVTPGNRAEHLYARAGFVDRKYRLRTKYLYDTVK